MYAHIQDSMLHTRERAATDRASLRPSLSPSLSRSLFISFPALSLFLVLSRVSFLLSLLLSRARALLIVFFLSVRPSSSSLSLPFLCADSRGLHLVAYALRYLHIWTARPAGIFYLQHTRGNGERVRLLSRSRDVSRVAVVLCVIVQCRQSEKTGSKARLLRKVFYC